jgi:hypothetical protein
MGGINCMGWQELMDGIKNGGPKYTEHVSSYWKGTSWNDWERMSEGFQLEDALQGGGSCWEVCWYAFTPTIGKDAFLRGDLHI